MKKLTVFQLFILMIISRIFITLLYMPPNDQPFNVSDLMTQIVIGTVLILITAVPIYLLAKDSNQNGLLTRCSNVSPAFGKVSAFLIMIGFLFFVFRNLVRFNIFATTVIFPESDLRFFLILTVLCSFYCIMLGLDVLGRTAEIFFTFIILSIVFVLAATAGRISFTNFTPLLYGGIKQPLESGFFTMSATLELLYPVMLKDRITGKAKVCIYPWIGTVMAFLFIMTFWQAGVLGDYANTQLFPFFSLTSLTTIGFLERLDALLTGSWVVSLFIKVAITIYIASDCLSEMFKSLSRKRATVLSSIFICLTCLGIRESYVMREFMTNISSAVVNYAIIVVILPVILLSAEKCRERGQKNAN